MTDWLTPARMVDVALVCVVLEALALWGLRHRWIKLARAGGVAANLAAGAILMIAVRIALSGGDWGLITLCLVASLFAHVADLWLRLTPIDKAKDER